MPSKKPTKNRKILFQEAVGKGSVFRIFPEDLVLEINESGILYDVRATEAPDEAFVKNIMKHGIIQPVTVKKIDGRPVVVAGRRRVLAAREANRRIMEQGGEPCVIVPCDDAANAKTDEDLYGIFIAENAIRRDDSPISRAEKTKHLLTLSQGNIDQVAITMGCSPQTIRNWMKLLELSVPVKNAVDTGKLSVSAAMELHGLSFDRQREALKEGAPWWKTNSSRGFCCCW